jgi:hypothetical protein
VDIIDDAKWRETNFDAKSLAFISSDEAMLKPFLNKTGIHEKSAEKQIVNYLDKYIGQKV